MSRKNMLNKLMVLGSDRKKRRKKVMSEKNQGLRHRGEGDASRHSFAR